MWLTDSDSSYVPKASAYLDTASQTDFSLESLEKMVTAAEQEFHSWITELFNSDLNSLATKVSNSVSGSWSSNLAAFDRTRSTVTSRPRTKEIHSSFDKSAMSFRW
jgi:hypothetical protein